MGGTGLEPVTPSLSSWFCGNDTRRHASADALNHAGLRAIRRREAAWLRRSVSRRLARYWPTSKRPGAG